MPIIGTGFEQRQAEVAGTPRIGEFRTLFALLKSPQRPGVWWLTDLNDPSHFHNRGFLLPLCKCCGLGMNCVGAGKPLAIIVKHGHLPVMVLAPRVFPERWALPTFHSANVSR